VHIKPELLAFLLFSSVALIIGVSIIIAIKWGVIKGMGQILVRRNERPESFRTNLIGLVIGFVLSVTLAALMFPALLHSTAR
jgi:hypothetical protein